VSHDSKVFVSLQSVQILDFFAVTMPPRKRKAIGQVKKERKKERIE
jgi:hypothetical protein